MEVIYRARVFVDANDFPVKMRADASKNADVIAKVPEDSIVDVLGIVGSRDGDWCLIRYNDMTGYMMRQFLIPVEDEETGETVEISVSDLEVWASTLEDLAESIRDKIGRG